MYICIHDMCVYVYIYICVCLKASRRVQINPGLSILKLHGAGPRCPLREAGQTSWDSMFKFFRTGIKNLAKGSLLRLRETIRGHGGLFGLTRDYWVLLGLIGLGRLPLGRLSIVI